MEFSRMKGISEGVRRAVGVNLTGGKTNAVEICQQVLKAPSFDVLLAMYQGQDIEQVKTSRFDLYDIKETEEETSGGDADDDD